MRALAVLLSCLACLPAFAEYRANVTLQITDSNQAFNLTILNGSTTPETIISANLVPNNNTFFDTVGTLNPSSTTVTPVIGANADGQSAPTVTLTASILPGQQWTAFGGDLDGSVLSAMTVNILFANRAEPVPVVLSSNGAVNPTWSGQAIVASDPLYQIDLSWIAPTENEDGTPYTDPAGFKIYWGSMEGSYANSLTLNNPSQTMHQVQVPYGRWYFVMTAVNSLTRESEYSNVAIGNAGPDPNPPNLDIPPNAVANGFAWLVFTVRNQIAFVEAGQVMPNSPCDGDQMVRGRLPTDNMVHDLALVPVQYVNLLPSIPADGELALFAECR